MNTLFKISLNHKEYWLHSPEVWALPQSNRMGGEEANFPSLMVGELARIRPRPKAIQLTLTSVHRTWSLLAGTEPRVSALGRTHVLG